MIITSPDLLVKTCFSQRVFFSWFTSLSRCEAINVMLHVFYLINTMWHCQFLASDDIKCIILYIYMFLHLIYIYTFLRYVYFFTPNIIHVHVYFFTLNIHVYFLPFVFVYMFHAPHPITTCFTPSMTVM